ncbi:mitochondrial mRNA pseudouridine synthase RPUSD3 isoform X2 [Phaenicophaeus curvirostris]|uniref:mitochondrial mRNA pseudouridine synthase RPUSD3 isoform X2 n=1 Tax=Phaenicophaeus curvirostris TaxID=33595 RepID=UPI0037F0FF1B
MAAAGRLASAPPPRRRERSHGGRGRRRARAGARRAGGARPGVGAAARPRGDAGGAGGVRGAPGRSPAVAEQAPRPARPGAFGGAEPCGAAASAETTPGPPCRAPRGEGSHQGVFWPCPPVQLPPHHGAAPAVLQPSPTERPVPHHILVVPVPAPGRRSLARKEVKNTLTRYRVLGAAGGCSLLQLQPKTAFPEQLPVHLTLLLCPALGDHKHSSRVGRVLGVSFLLPPEAAPARTQVLDEELMARLGLSPQQLHRLPLHLHLQRLELPQGPLCAPPPPPFLHTLRCLGLPEP